MSMNLTEEKKQQIIKELLKNKKPSLKAVKEIEVDWEASQKQYDELINKRNQQLDKDRTDKKLEEDRKNKLIQLKKSNRWYYSFDKNTKKYLGSGIAQICQKELHLIYPPNTTIIKLPKMTKNQDAFFIDGKWEIRESERSKEEKLNEKDENGIKLYRKNSSGEIVKRESSEISLELEKVKKEKDKIDAQIKLEALKNTILERILSKYATVEEKKELENITKIINS